MVRKVKYCECGCGQEIIYKPHYKWRGFPKYIHGHNRRNTKHSKKTIRIMSEKKIGKNNPMYNKHQTLEARTKIGDYHRGKPGGMRGKKHRPITIEKMRLKAKGKKKSKEHCEAISRGNKGKKKSKEHCEAMSKGKKGKPRSEKLKKQMQDRAFKKLLKNKNWTVRKGDIEIKFEHLVLKKIDNLTYKPQKYLPEIGFVDFFLPQYNLIIECDEKYHAQNKQTKRDSDRDFTAIFLYNYQTIRFSEQEINESPEKCIEKIIKLIKGNEYERCKTNT